MKAWIINIHRYIDKDKSNDTKIERYLAFALTEEQAKHWFKENKTFSNKSQDWYFGSVEEINYDAIIKL